jgi:hypothetical protein
MCYVGFHASVQARDAFNYWKYLGVESATAERVEIRNWVEDGGDKIVGLERRVIAMLGPEETRVALLLWTCKNLLYWARNSTLLLSADRKHAETIGNELIAYLEGKGPKPRKPARYSDYHRLIMTVRGEEGYSAGSATSDWKYGRKGTLSRLLLKKMGL